MSNNKHMPSMNARFTAIRLLKKHGQHEQVAEIFNALTPTELKKFYEFLRSQYYANTQGASFNLSDDQVEILEDICYFSTIKTYKPNNKTMKITIKTEVTREVLESIFITALEGGSNYWYYLSDRAIDLINEAVPRDGVKALSERLFEAVYDKGVVVPIHDIENTDDDAIGELNRETFQERMDLCSEKNPWSIMSELNEEGDASSSDVVFQYLALGELIYG
jgi:hypothetical protein